MPSSESPIGNAPVAQASLVGRSELVGEIVGLVGNHRLVTLTGTGGVGKTRLAVEVADAVTERFPDGVWMIELAPVGDPDSVPDVIAGALGVTPQGERPVIDAVADAVAGRELLLVIDNCEHLTRAAASAVSTILARSRSPMVLATSRESLWLAGEQRVAVGPLDLGGGETSAAVQLFAERAAAVRPGFSLEDAEVADAVVEICRTVDGLPLAIELAAARMAAMTAVELRDRLEHRFRLLSGAEHRPERQRTLGHLVAWSYELLGDDERRVLRTASVFVGGFTLAELTTLVGAVDEIEPLIHLDSLVHKSLVVATPRNGSTRYHLLETIRRFVEERSVAEGEAGRCRDRHAAMFGDEAASTWARWNGPGWRAASDWLEIELPNLRAALRWSITRDRIDTATDIAAHAALIGVPTQRFETIGWAEDLLATATDRDVARLPRLYAGAGYACFTGHAERAATHARTATRLEGIPRYDPCEPGLAQFIQALACAYSGDLDAYVQLAERVSRITRTASAFGLPAYVDGLQASGRVDEAIELASESVEAAREVGNPFWIAYALWTAGLAYANVDTRRALAAWDEGVAVVRDHRVDFFAGFLARDAARVHAMDGDAEVALELFAAAIDSFRQAGNVAQLVITVASVPALLERLGHLDEADSLCAAISRQPASTQHVPELTDLAERLADTLGADRHAAALAAADGLDLIAAAALARRQIDAVAAELSHTRTSEPPGGLSRREVEVLHLVAEGLTTREIAERLFISPKTADHHIQHVYTKAGVSNRAAATRWALDHGVIDR